MKKEKSENLLDIEIKHLGIVKKILKQFVPFKEVWAYGSRVKWTAGHKSDLDIVIFDPEKEQIFSLKEAFEESDLPFSVDIMNWNNIPESFQKNILTKYIILQEKPSLEDWKECKLGDVV